MTKIRSKLLAAGLLLASIGGALAQGSSGGPQPGGPIQPTYPCVGSFCYATAPLLPSLGGTGVANSNSSTITLGGAVNLSAGIITTGAGKPTLAFPSTSFTYTFQGSSDTIVGRATTDTLSNKTLASPVLSGTVTGNNTIPYAVLAQATADNVLGNFSASTANVATTALSNCPDTAGNHLNYSTSTHVFSCGTSGFATGPLWKLNLSGTQSISTSTLTLLHSNASVYDTASVCVVVSPWVCTPNLAGYYSISCTARIDMTAGPGLSASISRVALVKNGSVIPGGDSANSAQTNLAASAASAWATATTNVQVNGSTDTLGCEVYSDGATGDTVISGAWNGQYVHG